MLSIDGSVGEGGGQLLRSSLSLSVVTGTPFSMYKIRARRSKPGLMRQHLTALQAAARISDADVTGDAIGSDQITFRPRNVRAGEYRFSVGTAGSATLVFQTILPALMLASRPSILVLEGGTHNPFAPPFDFLEKAFLPVLLRMGPRVQVSLERHGFYPAGGGRFRAIIEPCKSLAPIALLERGDVLSQSARALVSSLPKAIADRELAVVQAELGWSRSQLRAEVLASGAGLGNALLLAVESEQVTEVFSGFGERGVSAEQVARGAVTGAKEYLDSGVPVGAHLADQLLLPLALAGEGAFRTLEPSGHTRSQAHILRLFLGRDVRVVELGPRDYRLEVSAA